VSHLAAFVSM